METVEEGRSKPKIATKRMKFHKIEDEGKEDRISALPDCLILEILSRLPSTRCAIRTGVLSKRWNYLWTSVPSLLFNGESYYPLTDFLSLVDKTLAQCRHSKLKRFAVFGSYNSQFESRVNNWIRYAISCNVEELKLRLSDWKAEFTLDQNFFISAYFTDLRLSHFKLNPTGAISWKSLRSLYIRHVKLDEDLIENILCGSPLLETLVFVLCKGYRRLNITSKSVKNLVFCGYFDTKYHWDDVGETVEINAPNIVSLTIQDELVMWKLLLVNVSSLVEANLDYEKGRQWENTIREEEEEMLKGFIVDLSHVKELRIGVKCLEVVSRLEAKGFIFPSNIKKLDVTPPLYSYYDSFDLSDS